VLVELEPFIKEKASHQDSELIAIANLSEILPLQTKLGLKEEAKFSVSLELLTLPIKFSLNTTPYSETHLKIKTSSLDMNQKKEPKVSPQEPFIWNILTDSDKVEESDSNYQTILIKILKPPQFAMNKISPPKQPLKIKSLLKIIQSAGLLGKINYQIA